MAISNRKKFSTKNDMSVFVNFVFSYDENVQDFLYGSKKH